MKKNRFDFVFIFSLFFPFFVSSFVQTLFLLEAIGPAEITHHLLYFIDLLIVVVN